MKRNINTIQNTDDMSLVKVTEKYLVEALANLGQRYSIKGDGISVKVNTIGKMIPEFDVDPTQYIVKVTKSLDELSVIFELLDNNLDSTGISLDPIPINNGIKIDSYSCIVNEIELKKFEKLYMYSSGNYFIYSGKQIIDENTEMFVSKKYDKYSNELVSSLKLYEYPFYDNNHSYNYIVLYLYKNSDNLYYLNIYHLYSDESDLLDAIADFAEHPDNPPYSFSPESFLSELYAQYRSNNTWLWQKHSTKVELTNSNYHEIIVYHVLYNSNDGSFIIDKKLADYSDELQPGEEYVDEEFYDTILFDTVNGIDKQIEEEQYSQTYIYRKLKTEYSNKIFKSNVNSTDTSYKTLFINILKQIFLKSYNGQPLYIPLDYEFEYTYNTNNEWQIYYSAKDICIHDVFILSETTEIDIDSVINTIIEYKDKSGLIRIIDNLTDDVEKSTFYSFYIEPDPESLTDIYSINVSKHFTMPYISPTGYWVVDDIETAIYAKGKNAGNPNITIVKSDPAVADSPTILSGGDKIYLESLDWCTKKTTIMLPKQIVKNNNTITYEQIKINNEPTFECYYFVPSLENIPLKKLEEEIDKLKYCIILNLSTINSIEGYNPDGEDEFSVKIREIYGEDAVIMTFWSLVYENGTYSFEAITKDGVAIDINYMTNFYNVLGYELLRYIPDDPDNFMFTQLVFDNVNYRIKNRGTADEEYDYPVYPVIKTSTIVSSASSQNCNSFNLKIEYNDRLVASYNFEDPASTLIGGENENRSYTSNITSIYQSEQRWLDNWIDAGSQTDTGEYTYENSTYLEYLPSDVNNSVPILDLSEVFVKDSTTLNKVNIVSLDENGNSYYSYIGTSHNTLDKSYLIIGTSKQNINIGTHTMVDERKELFNKQNELHIEFDNTRVASYAYIQNDLITEHDTISYGTTWRRFDIGGTTYWTTTFRQMGKFESNYAYLCKIDDNITSNIYEFFEGNNAFIAMTVPEKYKKSGTETTLPFDLYINDMISIPCLIKTISPTLSNEINSYNIYVESNNDVIYCDGSETDTISYIGVRLNSSMQKDIYQLEEIEGELTYQLLTIVNDEQLFVSNELEITYYINNSKYCFTINDMTNCDNMSYVHKLRNKYDFSIE